MGSPLGSLARTLDSRDLALLTVGQVIGSGIFIIPAETLRESGGRVPLALGVWLFGGALSLLGALSYAEMSAARPEAGGIYAYLRDAFGPLPAFLYGWVLFLAIGPATVAALAVASVGYAQELLPLGAAGGRAFALLSIAGIAALNVLGTRQSADAQNLATLLKAGAIVALGALLLARGAADLWGAPLLPEPASAALLSRAGVALIGVLWAYEGWQWVTFSAGEVADPQRSFPRGLVAGTALLVGLYLLANLGYLRALGAERAAGSPRIAAEAVSVVLGPAAAKLVAAVIVVSMLSAALSSVLTCSRVFFAMARDGLFFPRLARVHPGYGTPAASVLAVSALAALFAVTGSFQALITYVVFVAWIFYGWGGACLFVHRRRHPGGAGAFRVPGYPLTPILFVIAAAALVANTLATQPREAGFGLAVLASGVPAYLFWRRRSPPA